VLLKICKNTKVHCTICIFWVLSNPNTILFQLKNTNSKIKMVKVVPQQYIRVNKENVNTENLQSPMPIYGRKRD